MTVSGWALFAFVWILSNIIVKVLLDSIERIYRNEIDSTVKQLPLKIRAMTNEMVTTTGNRSLIVLLEIVRILAMVFFLPLFLGRTVFPFLRRIDYFNAQYQFIRTLYSREWMIFALIMLEVFSWRGLLLCILSVFQFSSDEKKGNNG